MAEQRTPPPTAGHGDPNMSTQTTEPNSTTALPSGEVAAEPALNDAPPPKKLWAVIAECGEGDDHTPLRLVELTVPPVPKE